MGEPTIIPNAEMEALKAELASAKAENKRLKQQARFGTELPEEMERSVADRMAAGLTREQAIQVERDQLRADEVRKKQEEDEGERAKLAAKIKAASASK